LITISSDILRPDSGDVIYKRVAPRIVTHVQAPSP